jgi:hypothetical protein
MTDVELPTWKEVHEKPSAECTALERFIHDHEPLDDKEWRADLAAVVEEAAQRVREAQRLLAAVVEHGHVAARRYEVVTPGWGTDGMGWVPTGRLEQELHAGIQAWLAAR